MSRKFIALVLAASIAVTGFSASTARASDAEAIVKFVGTAATLYVIGNAIKESREKDTRKVKVHDDRRRYDRDDRYGRNDRYDRYGRGHGDRGRYDNGHRGRDRDWHRGPRPLPAACLMRGYDRNKGRTHVLGARCVERNYSQARRLPNHCRVQMRTEKGVRVVYDTGCLRRQGFEVARR